MSVSPKYRIYVTNDLHIGKIITLDQDASHRLKNVLRCRLGEEIVLFNAEKKSCLAHILSIEKNVVIKILSYLEINSEPTINIHLLQALIKNDKLDYVLQKATELGVTEITPIITENTVAKLTREKIQNKLLHWQKIIIHAVEQSKRTAIPNINQPNNFKVILDTLPSFYTKLILHNQPSANHIKNIPNSGNFILAIGPEGGFSDFEIHEAESKGFLVIELGPRTLRAETCGLASISALQTLFGDF